MPGASSELVKSETLPRRGKRGGRSNREKQHLARLVKQPAPELMSRRVSLTSVRDLTGSSIAGNGFQSAYLSANGYGGPDIAGYTVPQVRIWNQYAAMFDFY